MDLYVEGQGKWEGFNCAINCMMKTRLNLQVMMIIWKIFNQRVVSMTLNSRLNVTGSLSSTGDWGMGQHGSCQTKT